MRRKEVDVRAFSPTSECEKGDTDMKIFGFVPLQIPPEKIGEHLSSARWTTDQSDVDGAGTHIVAEIGDGLIDWIRTRDLPASTWKHEVTLFPMIDINVKSVANVT